MRYVCSLKVFGRLVTSPEDSEAEDEKREEREEKGDGDNDLKEHMVSILFSRSKLSHMQKQVREECMKKKYIILF